MAGCSSAAATPSSMAACLAVCLPTLVILSTTCARITACPQLTGEDPDAIPDEPLPKRQHSGPSASERRQAGQQQDEQQPRGEAADGRGSQPSGGRLADAWQMPGSLFSLLTEAEPPGAGAKDSKEKKPHKEHKHKKEKHKKKDKVRLGHN